MANDVKEYRYCLRCGRVLKKEETRKIGYGKVCYEKMKNETVKKPLFTTN